MCFLGFESTLDKNSKSQVKHGSPMPFAVFSKLLGLKTAAAAAIGSAASNLLGGMTIHSMFAISVGPSLERQKRISSVRTKEKLVERIKDAAAIFIDEISTTSAEMLGLIDERCRDAAGEPNLAFGGKAVFLKGDFNQIPSMGKKWFLS